MTVSKDDAVDGRARSGRDGARASSTDEPSRSVASPGRRKLLSHGVKLAFVAPVVMTFSAKDALAAGSNHSCYPEGHACPGNEACCEGLACNDGVCSDVCVPEGGECYSDSDCCSGDCRMGSCQ